MAIRLVVRGPSGTDATADIVFEFDQQRVVIGRGTGADVRLPKGTVSEHHATIRLDPNGFVLVDESSTNGTYVDGVRLVPGRAKSLREGDVIRVSTFFVTFQKTAMPVDQVPSVERTAALARRMVRELLDPAGYAQQPAELVVTEGPNIGEKLVLPPAPARMMIGRIETADLLLTDADLSREHAEVIRDSEGTLLRDNESKNGVFVNDKRIRESACAIATKLSLEQPYSLTTIRRRPPCALLKDRLILSRLLRKLLSFQQVPHLVHRNPRPCPNPPRLRCRPHASLVQRRSVNR
ncbi:MAG: FHA domain-containing protein [Sandaracinaceae bacterium]|nr:FHA domain-containing protein [Sandaracinaceae bacterium]